MTKILVAGGTGLIGTNLARGLKETGAAVRASYHLTVPAALEVEYQKYDFTSFEDCLTATAGMEAVFICAAQVFGVKGLTESPSASILPNLQINAGIFEACRQNGVKEIVFISSSTVYQAAAFPIREDQLDLNLPPYELYFGVGWLNRYLEQLAGLYRKKHGMRILIVRPTNIYGPYDHFDNERSHVIPALIRRALQKKVPFVIWGAGGEVRDFIYVDDFIADLLAIFRLDKTGEPINVGSGTPITVREAAEIILKTCGHGAPVEYDAAKPTAIPYRAVDIGRLEVLCGRRPRTSLAAGIKQTVAWYQKEMQSGRQQ